MSEQHMGSAPANRALLATAIVVNTVAWALVVYWLGQFIMVLWRWAVGGV